jgi:hypothetical protein
MKLHVWEAGFCFRLQVKGGRGRETYLLGHNSSRSEVNSTRKYNRHKFFVQLAVF